MKKILYFVGVSIIVLVSFFAFNNYIYNEKQLEVIDFETCIAEGNPAMESYPRQCMTKDGKRFVEFIGNELEKLDMIQIFSPRPNEGISSPLTITGEARGSWFFEGNFPVVLVDSTGEVIAEHYATAQGEWMTEDFVPFTSSIEFKKPTYTDSKQWTLILKKDNPSGLPEYDDELKIPVSPENSSELDTSIMDIYDSRIVYTTNTNLVETPFVNDCGVRGGTFNACGSPCSPDAEICVSVCAYTCELPKK